MSIVGINAIKKMFCNVKQNKAEFIPLFLAVILIINLFLYSQLIFAKNLGVLGQTYPIQEIDFLDFIQSRILIMQEKGGLIQLQNKMVIDAKNYRDRPAEVSGISHATQTKSWRFDPSMTLDHN